MAVTVRLLLLWVFVMFINLSKTASEAKESKPQHHSKSMHQKSKSLGQQRPEQKSSLGNSGLAFEETSTELIKSRLDKSLGVLGPWKQNAGDLYMGNMGLLNQPSPASMRINGYPINPKGSMSLTQMIDGSLDKDLDLQQIVGQMKFPSRPLRGQWFRGMAPMGMGQSRGGTQSIMGRMMLGGHKRGEMEHERKLSRSKPLRNHVINMSSRGTTLGILGKTLLHRTAGLRHRHKQKMKNNISIAKENADRNAEFSLTKLLT